MTARREAFIFKLQAANLLPHDPAAVILFLRYLDEFNSAIAQPNEQEVIAQQEASTL
jgi:hypothetical protein